MNSINFCPPDLTALRSMHHMPSHSHPPDQESLNDSLYVLLWRNLLHSLYELSQSTIMLFSSSAASLLTYSILHSEAPGDHIHLGNMGLYGDNLASMVMTGTRLGVDKAKPKWWFMFQVFLMYIGDMNMVPYCQPQSPLGLLGFSFN